jgi:hypothetical protein
MPRFQLNDCSLSLRIEPLSGELAPADRHLAWRLYLALVTQSALRSDQMPQRELHDLIHALRTMLDDWPAARIEAPRPGQLGFLVVTIIETILLPCVSYGEGASGGWPAVRQFCDALAREIAQTYGFPDAGANMPKDLLAAWHGLA